MWFTAFWYLWWIIDHFLCSATSSIIIRENFVFDQNLNWSDLIHLMKTHTVPKLTAVNKCYYRISETHSKEEFHVLHFWYILQKNEVAKFWKILLVPYVKKVILKNSKFIDSLYVSNDDSTSITNKDRVLCEIFYKNRVMIVYHAQKFTTSTIELNRMKNTLKKTLIAKN